MRVMVNKLSLLFTRRPWLVPLILAAVTLVMHHSALNGFWRFDDGWFLGFATCYAPWEYFFLPSFTREISYAYIMPWLPLTYDINLAFFGLNPLGHYAHQLISLWLAAYMSFLVLRLWIGLGWAVFGATLFLVGAPTANIAQYLTTGHYLEGLIFACVAIYGFIRAMRNHGKYWGYWLALGVFSYGLACTCKEIYVPLPVILLALPEGEWKRRLHFVAPFLAVTLLYLGWRTVVLGTFVGGYQHDWGNIGFIQFSKTLLTYIKLPTFLFSHNLLGYLALASLATLLLFNTSRRGWLLVLVTAGVVLLPLAPVIIWPGILGNERYLFAVWWAVALGVAVLAGMGSRYLGRYPCLILAVIIGVAAFQAGRSETKAITLNANPLEALYRFALTNGPDDTLIPSMVPWDSSWDYAQFMYNGLLSAASGCSVSKSFPRLLSSVEAIAAIDPKKAHVYHYDANCRCTKEVTSSSIPELLSTLPLTRENRRLKAVFLPPPYRPRRDQPRITDTNPHGGIVESINQTGETIEITGWARLRDDEPQQSIALFIPILPVGQSLVSIERPDIVKQLNNPSYLGAGFRIALQFSSVTNAAYVAAHLCAAKMAGGSFASIENPANPECSVLFQQ